VTEDIQEVVRTSSASAINNQTYTKLPLLTFLQLTQRNKQMSRMANAPKPNIRQLKSNSNIAVKDRKARDQ